jgi:hypothetical protein
MAAAVASSTSSVRPARAVPQRRQKAAFAASGAPQEWHADAVGFGGRLLTAAPDPGRREPQLRQ